MSRTTYSQWYGSLPIPFLVGGPNGQAEAQSWPAFLDFYMTQLDAARKVAFADTAPADALPYLGADRKLIQGPSESDDNFRIRIKTAWDDWSRAGTFGELLVQLYWGGFGDAAVIVQQNGLATTLSGAPTAGVDPTSLFTVTPCATLSVALTSNVTPPTSASAGRNIPSGTNWWQFAESASINPNVSDTDYCNRFAVLFPTAPSNYPFTANTLSILKTLLTTWRPNSQLVGVYVCTAGKFMGWPVQTQATNTMGAATIVRVLGD